MDTVPTNFITAAQSKAFAVFDPLAQSLQLHANTSGPARTVAKLSPQLYGQFEVSAKVSMHPGVITSIDVSDKHCKVSGALLTVCQCAVCWAAMQQLRAYTDGKLPRQCSVSMQTA